MVRIAAAIAAMAVVAAAAARPASVEHLFREFDLFGVWAADCVAAASIDNPHVSVGMPEPGRVLEQHDFGPGYEANRYVIVAARRISHERLTLETLFEQGQQEPQRQRIILRVEDRHRRTMFNATHGEEPRVLNGIAIATGLPTPILNKCE